MTLARSLLCLASAPRPLGWLLRDHFPALLGLGPAVAVGAYTLLFTRGREDVLVSLFAVVLPYSLGYLLGRLRRAQPLVAPMTLIALVSAAVILLWAPAPSPYEDPSPAFMASLGLGFSFLGILIATFVPHRAPRFSRWPG